MDKKTRWYKATHSFNNLMVCIRLLKLSKAVPYGLAGEKLYRKYVWWTPEWYEEKKT